MKKRPIVQRIFVLGLLMLVAAGAVFAGGTAEKPEAQKAEAERTTGSTEPMMVTDKVYAPESADMNGTMLSRLDDVIQREVDKKLPTGATVLVSRHGKIVYHKSFGKAAEGRPTENDAIYRMVSSSKIVSGVAIGVLVDQGKIISVYEPISNYLPEFKDMVVTIKDENGEIVGAEPAKREITIADLLRMTSGIQTWDTNDFTIDLTEGYGLERTRNDFAYPPKNEDYMPVVASLPLSWHPGEEFFYDDASIHVVEAVVEKASGQRYDEFCRDNIFLPLGMKDTYFTVPEEKWDRVTGLYYVEDMQNGTIGDVYESESLVGKFTEQFIEAPFSEKEAVDAAAGICSTAYDYFLLQQMLLNGGELNGTRILGEHSVRMITINQLPGDLRMGHWGIGWGYGCGVRDNELPIELPRPFQQGADSWPLGSYGWLGFCTTHWVNSPQDDVVITILTNAASGAIVPTFCPLVKNIVWAAVED